MTNLILKSMVVASVSAILFSACSSKKETAKQSEPKFVCQQDGLNAPQWTCNPEQKGYIAAVGIAKMNVGNDKSFQKAEAMNDGRNALASQIETKVGNLFKSYKATTGNGEAATFDKATSQVSKQVVSQTLSGSKSIANWRHPKTNELYLLVVTPTSNVKSALNNEVKTSFKNDEALYQKFLADQASGELEKELEKLNY
jgi:hypothetical protein